jgi:hypothetical protein
MSTSTWISGDSIMTGRILGTGLTQIERETDTQTSPYSGLLARSGGTLLIGEYTSVSKNNRGEPVACVLGNTTHRPSGMETGVSGILERGNYSRVLALDPAEMSVSADGRGMIDLRHRLVGNGTVSGRTFASGNVSVRETIRRDDLS